MKFKGHQDINQPLEKVAAYFADPQYLGEYQDGFVKKELISGEEGKDGAISEMLYHQQGRDLLMTETIVSNQLPHSFEAFYHHKHMDNTMKCTFTALSENQTRYEYEFEYVRMAWVIPKLMGLLFPSMFRKQGEKWMTQFKEFVEKQS